MEIWLSNGTKDRIRLPVNPESIGYNDTRNHEDIILANGDEKTVLGGRSLRSFSIASFFPKNQVHYSPVKILTPTTYVQKIKKWMDDKEVLQLQVTTTVINESVTIRSFEWEEKGGAVGDIEYTIELKEYEPISFTKSSPAPAPAPGKNPAPPGKQPLPPKRPVPKAPAIKTHIVKSGESLWIISKKYYGAGSKWTNIYNRNKTVVGKNPNLIKPGMKLVIP